MQAQCRRKVWQIEGTNGNRKAEYAPSPPIGIGLMYLSKIVGGASCPPAPPVSARVVRQSKHSFVESKNLIS